MIDRLLEEYRSNDPLVTKLLNKYELHVLTLANPGILVFKLYQILCNILRIWNYFLKMDMNTVITQ